MKCKRINSTNAVPKSWLHHIDFDYCLLNLLLLFFRERFNAVLGTSPPSDDIPELPDFEDIIDESALNDAKEAQAIAMNRVETYKELNSELLKYSEFASSENIDLSKLMQCLQDESVLADHDVPLTKEQLFSEVASFIYARKMSSADDSAKSAE